MSLDSVLFNQIFHSDSIKVFLDRIIMANIVINYKNCDKELFIQSFLTMVSVKNFS